MQNLYIHFNVNYADKSLELPVKSEMDQLYTVGEYMSVLMCPAEVERVFCWCVLTAGRCVTGETFCRWSVVAVAVCTQNLVSVREEAGAHQRYGAT